MIVEVLGHVFAGMMFSLICVVCGYEWGYKEGRRKEAELSEKIIKNKNDIIIVLDETIQKAKKEHYLTD